jgi:hypothetical protein
LKSRSEKIPLSRLGTLWKKVILLRNPVFLGIAHSEVQNITELREKIRFDGTANICKYKKKVLSFA